MWNFPKSKKKRNHATMQSIASAVLCILYFFQIHTSAYAQMPLQYEIIATQPHFADTFTQGLITQGPYIVESSGLYGKSFMQKYHADNNTLVWRNPLPKHLFAEGLTLLNHTYYVLSWKKGELLRFDSKTLSAQESLYYKGQGWGLTHDNTHLIMSDGSARLYYKHPDNFITLRTINVTLNGRHISRLNELEFAKGSVFSNVWMQNVIIRIDPKSGHVTGLIDLTGLAEKNNLGLANAVLNGIAYDRKRDAFWVTGKYWPKRYLIRLKD